MEWRAGTSGFSYDEWVGPFYPEELPGAKRLAYYAERLPAVEINNTFYRLPKAEMLAGWAARVPPGFRFALKASRRITHAAKDADPSDAVAHLFRAAEALGEQLGPVLFQLPPWARKDVARLRALLALVPDGHRVAFEFRHPSWLDDEVYAALREAGAALCAADFDDAEKAVPLVATAPFGYVRLRAADYPTPQLRAWADSIGSQPWREAYVFFKHEDEGAAPLLARRLLAIAQGLDPEEIAAAPKRAPAPARRPARATPRRRPSAREEG
jgi:uncharacterized protein YecE (DUF72 family)